MPLIAKLAIQSGLPQLDRLFDYLVPASLTNVKVGCRVKVFLGRSKKLLDAFVVELSQESEFTGRLSEIQSVITYEPVLRSEIFNLCSQLAERSASPLGELIKLAVPAHMPRTFSNHNAGQTQALPDPKMFNWGFGEDYLEQFTNPGFRSFAMAEPRELPISGGSCELNLPSWASFFLGVSVVNLAKGSSTILLVPDYREQAVLVRAIEDLGLGAYLADYSQELPKSRQFAGFLRALDAIPRIIIGSRSAAYAPAHSLASILVFDEADGSYIDKSSPYLSTRDVVLVRQAIQNCSLVFSSHAISTDLMRLLESGYLDDQTLRFASPRISISEPGFRVDSHAYSAIRQGLTQGAVLVQVSSLGDSAALFCGRCEEPAACTSCNGPLWVDATKSRKCRWCNGFAMDHICSCGSREFSLGRPGASRTAAELGRAFPAARVIESTGENRLIAIPAGKTLVIATAGAEPYVPGGYLAVVLLDAKVLMSRQSLRTTEEAVRLWSNAVAKARAGAPCVLVGVSGDLAQLFALWNQSKIALNELLSRRQLQLPPEVRMGSVTAELDLIMALSEVLSTEESISRIGPAPVNVRNGTQLWRLIFKYPYSRGVFIAKLLKTEVSRLGAGKIRISNSGRNARALTVKMNDADVV